jgi:hypothetical protein
MFWWETIISTGLFMYFVQDHIISKYKYRIIMWYYNRGLNESLNDHDISHINLDNYDDL